MRYGTFDDEKLEYCITQPDTPLPWINYLGTEDFFGLISNTAGGYCFYRDARLRRLTRYRYNNVPADSGGRYLYLRDRQTDDYWSPTWQPVQSTLDHYSCRHGLGYTVIASERKGIAFSGCYFIPIGENLEIWDITITNRRKEEADLSLFSFIEFCLWDAQDDATNFQRNYNIAEVEVEGSTIFHKTEYRERRNHFAFFHCSDPIAGFDTQREAFLGLYRGFDQPQAVEQGVSFNSIATSWQPIGSHQVQFHLSAGESRRIIFLLGYHENPRSQKFDPPESNTLNKKTVYPIIREWEHPERVDRAFSDLKSYWKGILQKFSVRTPVNHVDRMINTWNAYQCMVTFNLSRSASYFESGIGRGMGFRDSNQDLLGFMHMDPERARQRILDLAATQLENGGAYHQYQPLTKRGNNDIGSGFNDDPLWLVLSTSAYLRETGDYSILEESVPFENQPGSEQPLLEHLDRCISYTKERLGPHGLPLIGRADWNDCLNLNCFSDSPGQSFQTTTNREGKNAESVFIGGLFVLAANAYADILDILQQTEKSTRIRSYANEMAKVTDMAGWDGQWFLRAYDDQGAAVGSHHCTEGKIFIEPQGICTMAGIGLDNGHAVQALNSLNAYLSGKDGIALLWPAFTHYYINLGEITSYPPGYKENGSVFCHTNPWIMIAETKLGDGDRALDYYLKICPSFREEISEIHRCEPYVYAQTIAGPESPTPGEAKNSWLTGTAAWNYVAITQYILGIRPELTGLRVEPIIPKDWEGFQVVRDFRGIRYNISVKRKGKGNHCQLNIDGQDIEGTVIPLSVVEGKKQVMVQAIIQ
ncbi:MAG TPA: glycosyl transferase [Flexilinea sp.]|nr:glycosyl transferase [Flexilinea sp.]